MAKATKVIPRFDDTSPWGTYRLNSLFASMLWVGQAMPYLLSPISKVTRHPVKYWVNTPVDLAIWGLKLRLTPRGNISEQKLYTSPRQFDRPEMQAMAKVLKDGGTFVDIGANAGIYSFWAHACSKGRCRVLAFEPDPEMRRRLAFNLHTNAMANVTVSPCALSDKNGIATFWVNENQRGTNSLETPDAGSLAKRKKTEVEIRTLVDALAEQHINRVDVLKIDVEGHEPPILRHFFANAARDNWPKILIAETMHLPQSELAMLVPQDHYRLESQTSLNAIWVAR
jgi:FkbM family methyltransferase